MYGEGNSAKLVRDVMVSADQVIEGVKASTGIDVKSILAGLAGGKIATALPTPTSTVESEVAPADASKTEN
jgi:flotillin